MTLRRGDVVYVSAKGPYTRKPRPAVVIQANDTLPYRDSVTVCPITSELIDAPLFRIRIEPSADNGLDRVCDVMADKVLTVPKATLGPRPVGKVTAAQLERLTERYGSGSRYSRVDPALGSCGAFTRGAIALIATLHPQGGEAMSPLYSAVILSS